MGMLDNIAASLRTAITTVSEKAQQFQNQSFADACMASCALVSMADGVLQPEERSKVVACIQNIRDLHCFKATDLRDLFDGFCSQSGDMFSRVEVIKAIRKVRADRDQADMVVKIGLIIAKSKGGELAECEKTVMREIIHELGLSESDYDLSSSGRNAAPAPAPAPNAPAVTPRPAPTIQPPAPTPAPATRQPRVQGTSLKEAKAGERVSFKQVAGAAPAKIVAGFGWEAPTSANLTAAALVFDKDKKLLQKVAVGNSSGTAGGVSHNGNTATTSKVGDDEEISLSLASLPAAAASILFVVASANGQSVQGAKSAYVRLTDPDKASQLIRFDFAAPADLTALVVGRVYLNNGDWKFAAVGDAVRGGADAVQTQIATFA
jgi:tellurite resistance protein/stress response protein SCP2